MGIPGSFVDLGVIGETGAGPEQPYSAFIIQPEPNGNVMGSTEADIRAGGKWIEIWLGDDKFKVVDAKGNNYYDVVQTSIVAGGYQPQAAGWTATVTEVHRVLPNVHTMDADKTSVRIDFQPVANYAIDYPEYVKVNIHPDIVESQMSYDGGGDGFFPFWIYAFPSAQSTLLQEMG